MRIIPKRRAICKHNFAEYAEKEKPFARAKRFWAKTYPRRSRANPIITCTKGQVGCLFAASLLPTSTTGQSRGREACNRHRKFPASPEYNVGLSGPVTHPAGTRLLRSHILLWAAEAAFMSPALPRPRRSDPSAHCRPPQALRRLQWPQGIPRRFPPRT